MSKNTEILKGINFDNLDENSLKRILVEKFSKNINKEIIPGVSYIPVSGKVIDEDDILWGIESMMDAWLTAGRFSLKLEKELAKYFGSRFAFLVNSGSSANLLALASLRLKKNSEIITPTLTFSTTVAPIYQLGLTPSFIDVEADKFIVDVKKIEKSINKNTKAMIIPNLLGNIPDYRKIMSIAKKYSIKILFLV